MTGHGGWLAASLLAVALPAARANDATPLDLAVTVGMSLILDTPADLRRVSVANGDLAEALAVNPREVLINGKAPGETSVILWQQDGVRTMYDLTVRQNTARITAVQAQLKRGLPGQDVSLDFENDTVFLRGTVKDLSSAERAAGMAATLGKVVNLLRVDVPAVEPQILLHVKFADVDRAATTSFGVNLLSTGAGNTIGQVTTGQFGPAVPNVQGSAVQFTLSDALNIFLFRKDLNLGTLIQALEASNLLQMLAEPNVLAINGKPASFVAGGEFPFPVVQGGSAAGAVTIQFREYGVRINFLPVVTPRGTIRLQVAPEVSSLDYANALQFQGYTIPALATRRVQTQVELESGQSFVIAGLLDNTITDSLNKIPGIGDIPLLGKLFQSRSRTRSNSELMILITPELVRPIPAGAALPEVRGPQEYLPGTAAAAPRTPGPEVTGAVRRQSARKDMPLEELLEIEKQKSAAPALPQTSPAQGTAPGGIH
ncbi:MAG TPA: pilus assembly protein N-terminal domain-containing protein [Bryobacteraceae bacterium]|jgi:pilus assembly protein CpaC|nr:pilus assembly protein N-terminal domain-containing protein [Bryobacteraceae bacterium]